MAEEKPTEQSQPASTVAQSFAADLDSMFGLNSGIGSLHANVEERKAKLGSGQTELEQLEAKLRETEQRLAKVSRGNSPARQADSGAETKVPEGEGDQKQAHPLSQKPAYPDSRPPTEPRQGGERQDTQEVTSNMPGAMPETPGRDDYVMVDDGRGR